MRFEADGYGLIENVMPTNVMDTLEVMLDSPKTCIKVAREWSRDIAQDLIGSDLTDTGEAVVHHNPERIYDQWHYDIPWDSNDGTLIPCWRFAFYFRDYTQTSGCLSVIPESHLGPIKRAHNMPAHPIQSKPGDLVIWNLRTMHKPNTAIRFLNFSSPRNAIIFDYAKPGPDVEKYKAWRRPKRIKEGMGASWDT